MFKETSAVFVLREKRQKVLETVCESLQHPKANVREAAVTIILNYSVQFLTKDDAEGKIQALSGLGMVSQEAEQQCKKRVEAAVTNLTFKNKDGKDLAKALGLLN
mmetsp:Transcript_7062/g.11895  ORF Transcript_7062/g.11895 Transcript_7062/m.11895 type:complete len:105 (+) Transcript_7062:1879-2193(+)